MVFAKGCYVENRLQRAKGESRVITEEATAAIQTHRWLSGGHGSGAVVRNGQIVRICRRIRYGGEGRRGVKDGCEVGLGSQKDGAAISELWTAVGGPGAGGRWMQMDSQEFGFGHVRFEMPVRYPHRDIQSRGGV